MACLGTIQCIDKTVVIQMPKALIHRIQETCDQSLFLILHKGLGTRLLASFSCH